jgi:putative oxidoreductase
VAVGALFLTHGWQRLADVKGTVATFSELGVSAPELWAYLTIGAECVGGFGVLLGAFTRIAAFGALVSTCAAIYLGLAVDGLAARNGSAEAQLILLLVCLHVAVRGGGAFSVDARLRPRGRPRFRRRHRHVAVQT